MNQAIIPKGHPNRREYRLEAIHGYIVHSTANLWAGAGDEFHADYFRRNWRRSVENIALEEDGVTVFRRGATHVAVDKDSETQFLPFDEYAPGAGDRPLVYDNLNKGQRPLARIAFENRQNWRTLQIEICEAGGWNHESVDRAINWIADDMRTRGLALDAEKSMYPDTISGPPADETVYLLRHWDLTGKHCPTKLWNNEPAWRDFVKAVERKANRPE